MGRTRVRVPKEIFLSHSQADRKFVNRLIKVLQAFNIRFWYSRSHLVGAQEWQDEIGRALDRCDWFALVLSPAAIKSEWVRRELSYALNERRYRGRIVPLLIRPCQHKRLSWTLSAFQFVDFSDDFALGCERLLRVWGKHYLPESKPRRMRLGKTRAKP
jgi:hypothetical protein